LAELAQSRELLQTPLELVVQARVLDRHRGVAGQQQSQTLVVLIEFGPVEAVREVEVAEHPVARRDRDSQE